MIGIIVAMPIEAQKILAAFSEIKEITHGSIKFYLGVANGADIVMMLSGVGKVNAAYGAALMIERYAPKAIISTGIVGGLGKLPTLTVLVPDSFCQHDMDTSPLGDPIGFVSGVNRVFFKADETINNIILANVSGAVGGTLASGDQFICRDADAQRISSQFGAVACDMEAGAIAQVCYINNVPFGAIKVVSDSGSSGAEITYKELAEKASEINSKVLVSILQKLDIN